MGNFKEEIINGVWEVLQEASRQEISKESISVEPPKNPDFGDYTTNIALKTAKVLGCTPMEAALKLQKDLVDKCPWIERITVVAPGFINFFIGDQSLYGVLGRPSWEYKEMLSVEEVPSHWRKKLEILLEDDEFHRGLKDMQYVHSRIHSILKLLREDGIKLEEVAEDQVVYEKSDLEKEVLRRLENFPQQIDAAKKQDQPEEILNYGVALAKLFFKLHEKTLFRKLERDRLQGALRVMEAMMLTIKTILDAFAIEAPEKM